MAYQQMGRGLNSYEYNTNEYDISNLDSKRITHRSRDRKQLFDDELVKGNIS